MRINQMTAARALAELRRHIKASSTQFRHSNDNSESLFHPAGGFVYAYDSAAVDAALDWFEGAIDTLLDQS